MIDPRLSGKVQDLSDVELAILLCLIAEQHCIIGVDSELILTLCTELELISTRVFGLRPHVVDCSQLSSSDVLGDKILLDNEDNVPLSATLSKRSSQERRHGQSRNASTRPSQLRSGDAGPNDTRLPGVVVFRGLESTDRDIQVQVLEIIRTRLIHTGSSTLNAPGAFVTVVLLAGDGTSPRLISHLNDHFFLYHHHEMEDGFPNLEENSAIRSEKNNPWTEQDADRFSSSVAHTDPLVADQDINALNAAYKDAKLSVELRRYLRNIVVFLRMHRAVAGGVSAPATKHFDMMVRCMTVLNSLSFATPSMVCMAARKVYPHRIRLAPPEDERSLQWGSERDRVAEMLEGLTTTDVIEDVLASVEVPL